MLVIPFVIYLLFLRVFELFKVLFDLIPPIVWLTFGSLAIAVLVGILGSVFAVRFKRRKEGSLWAPPAPIAETPAAPIPSSNPFEAADEYEPPATLLPSSNFQVLVLCSPVSGSGEGVDIFERIVQPMLRRAGIRLNVIFLEKGAQAFETAAELEAGMYSGLVVIGGDKVLHEVLQGLAVSVGGGALALGGLLKSIILGLVPCGSRNGLANSLGLTDPFIAVKRIVERVVLHGGRGRAIDLYSVHRLSGVRSGAGSSEGQPIFDFFLTSWGVAADVSLAVERGPQFIPRNFRLFFAALFSLFTLKAKQGSLTLTVQASSPAEVAEKNLPKPEERVVTLTGKFTLVSVSNVARISEDLVLAPGARPDDGRLHVSVIRHCSRWHALRTLLAVSAGEELAQFAWVQGYVCSRVVISNETGEVDICGFGEEELEQRKYQGDGVLIQCLPRTAWLWY